MVGRQRTHKKASLLHKALANKDMYIFRLHKGIANVQCLLEKPLQ